jgi:anti-sigma B factor antagonist
MIELEKRDKIDIITFTVDKINALITEDIREKISKVFENGNSKVIIDLKGVEYIDSSGFGCLLAIMRTARNSFSTLKFARPEPSVMSVLETLNLHTVFDIYSDLDVCVRSLR